MENEKSQWPIVHVSLMKSDSNSSLIEGFNPISVSEHNSEIKEFSMESNGSLSESSQSEITDKHSTENSEENKTTYEDNDHPYYPSFDESDDFIQEEHTSIKNSQNIPYVTVNRKGASNNEPHFVEKNRNHEENYVKNSENISENSDMNIINSQNKAYVTLVRGHSESSKNEGSSGDSTTARVKEVDTDSQDSQSMSHDSVNSETHEDSTKNSNVINSQNKVYVALVRGHSENSSKEHEGSGNVSSNIEGTIEGHVSSMTQTNRSQGNDTFSSNIVNSQNKNYESTNRNHETESEASNEIYGHEDSNNNVVSSTIYKYHETNQGTVSDGNENTYIIQEKNSQKITNPEDISEEHKVISQMNTILVSPSNASKDFAEAMSHHSDSTKSEEHKIISEMNRFLEIPSESIESNIQLTTRIVNPSNSSREYAESISHHINTSQNSGTTFQESSTGQVAIETGSSVLGNESQKSSTEHRTTENVIKSFVNVYDIESQDSSTEQGTTESSTVTSTEGYIQVFNSEHQESSTKQEVKETSTGSSLNVYKSETHESDQYRKETENRGLVNVLSTDFQEVSTSINSESHEPSNEQKIIEGSTKESIQILNVESHESSNGQERIESSTRTTVNIYDSDSQQASTKQGLTETATKSSINEDLADCGFIVSKKFHEWRAQYNYERNQKSQANISSKGKNEEFSPVKQLGTFLRRMSSLIKGKFEEADDYELGIIHSKLSASQKFSSRYRSDSLSYSLSKTERGKQAYTPTVPPYVPLESKNQPVHIYPEKTMQMVYDEAAGVWNMVEIIPNGLTRSEIIVDTGDGRTQELDDLQGASATISIYSALADILTKNAPTTTTTTTTTTSTTTELPEIIKVSTTSSTADNPVLLDILKKNYIRGNGKGSKSVFSLTTAKSAIDSSTVSSNDVFDEIFGNEIISRKYLIDDGQSC
uniref:Uncharacterized protein n=1 Tax=Megaselia scalaris TaxID=36166 RepID=T1GQ39_MEGSC